MEQEQWATSFHLAEKAPQHQQQECVSCPSHSFPSAESQHSLLLLWIWPSEAMNILCRGGKCGQPKHNTTQHPTNLSWSQCKQMSCINTGCDTPLPLSHSSTAESRGYTLDTGMEDTSPHWPHNHMIHKWTAVLPQYWQGSGIHGTQTLPWPQRQLKLHVTVRGRPIG